MPVKMVATQTTATLRHTSDTRCRLALDVRTIGCLGEIGRAKGIGPSTLARMWLLERLDQEK